jgi:ABC-type amino acid transport substrate-binding protein
MKYIKYRRNGILLLIGLMITLLYASVPKDAGAGDLKELQQRGVLRHLGITYAHFVRKTPGGYDGLDVEVMKLFAKHLGLRYQFVNTTWSDLFTDLTGRELDAITHEYHPERTKEIKGDIISNGLTVLAYRQKIVNYSIPTFPTGVWLIAQANSSIVPINPSGNMSVDIENVKSRLKGHSVLTMNDTCLDAGFFNFDQSQVEVKFFTQSKIINDIVPAMLNGMADATLLDIPDAMVALQKWPGEIKIIGPVIDFQVMGTAVSKSSPEILHEFNKFFKQIWQDGTYRLLVEKYYPSVFLYFENFFDINQ